MASYKSIKLFFRQGGSSSKNNAFVFVFCVYFIQTNRDLMNNRIKVFFETEKCYLCKTKKMYQINKASQKIIFFSAFKKYILHELKVRTEWSPLMCHINDMVLNSYCILFPITGSLGQLNSKCFCWSSSHSGHQKRAMISSKISLFSQHVVVHL